MKLITAKIETEWIEKKKKLDYHWRFLISKGFLHMEQCVPRAEFLEENFQKALHARNNMRLKYWLQKKYPKIWDEFVTEVEWSI